MEPLKLGALLSGACIIFMLKKTDELGFSKCIPSVDLSIKTQSEVEVAGRVKTRWNARTVGKMDTTYGRLGQIKEKGRRR